MVGERLRIEAHSERYDEADAVWESQVRDLLSQLGSEVDVTTERKTEAGTKGDAATIILALGTAGAFQAAVQILSAWLKSDRSRKLKLARTTTKQGEWVTIDA